MTFRPFVGTIFASKGLRGEVGLSRSAPCTGRIPLDVAPYLETSNVSG